MKRLYALCGAVALSLLLVACGDNLNSINGVWAVDADATLQAQGVGSGPEADMAKAMAAAMLEVISVEFNVKKKEMTASFGGQAETVPFTVASEKNKEFVIKSGDNTITVTVLGKDAISIAQEGKTLIMKRAAQSR